MDNEEKKIKVTKMEMDDQYENKYELMMSKMDLLMHMVWGQSQLW